MRPFSISRFDTTSAPRAGVRVFVMHSVRRPGDGRPRPRELEIEVPAPFRLDLTVWALRRRAHNEVDRWDGRVYRRALHMGEDAQALSVTQTGPLEAPRLGLTVAGAGVDGHAEALASGALDRLLGRTVDLSGFGALAVRDPRLTGLARRLRGLKPPRFPTVFEALVNGIACQQLSLTVGIHLLNRLTARHGRAVAGVPGGLRAFPTPEALASATVPELRAIGFSGAKADAIIKASAAIADGVLDLEALQAADDRAAVGLLTSLRGVGRWTAEYALLRGLGRLHVFPGDDVGARNTLSRVFGIEGPLDYAGVSRLAAQWSPYAGMVYFSLLVDSLSEAGLLGGAGAWSDDASLPGE